MQVLGADVSYVRTKENRRSWMILQILMIRIEQEFIVGVLFLEGKATNL